MSKTFILQKDIESPMGCIAAGTESIFDGGFYCFPYIGRKYNDDNNGWLGNSFMTSDPSSMPEWFILKTENKSNDSFQWASDEDILEIIHRTFAPSDPNHEFTLKRLQEYKSEKRVSNSFQWTDELVKGILRMVTSYDDDDHWKERIKTFKQSHTPKPQAEKPNTFIMDEIGKTEPMKPPLGVIPEYLWKEQRLEDIRQAMIRWNTHYKSRKHCPQEWLDEKHELEKWFDERNLENDLRFSTPQAENKPDWEIVSVLDTMTNDTYPFNSIDDKGRFKIHSVKRLSDGEVFSVGDEVEWGRDGYRGGATITKFYIDNGYEYYKENFGLYFDTNGGNHKNHIGFCSAENLQKKLPPQPQKEEQGIKKPNWNFGETPKSKPQEQRIEVSQIYRTNDKPHLTEGAWYHHTFNTSLYIPDEKLPALKQAIEQVLNDDGKSIVQKMEEAWNKFTIKYPDIKDKEIRKAIELLVNSGYVVEHQDKFNKAVISWYHPFYTQQQVDAMCEDAFNAAREKEALPQSIMRVPSIFQNNKYVNYEDYKSQRDGEKKSR